MSHILYVEDEPFLAKVVKETLELKEFKVTHLASGSNVLEELHNQDFDICVLDIMLPGKNGFDVAKDIRTIHKQIPILFLTAKDQTADVVQGFGVGGNDYIKKPFSMEELIVRIRNLLQLQSNNSQKSESIQTEYHIGVEHRFQPKRFELSVGDTIKKLSHKETMILDLLCQHKNEIASRKDILLKVWGDDSFYNSRNLDVYITKLRGYFASDKSIEIMTLKGVGYQFSDANTQK